MNGLSDFDIGPLTWVKAEVDGALEAALSQLEAWNGADVTPLKGAATHLHQVSGALQIVDLQGVSQVCAAVEGLLAEAQVTPALRNRESATMAIKGIHALRQYLDGLLDGMPNAELALMPIFEEIQAKRGVEPPAPSELFFPDLSPRARRITPELPLEDDLRARALRAARAKYQKGLVQMLQRQDPGSGIALLEEAVREVGQLAPGPAQYTFWWAAAGAMETLLRRDGTLDVWSKRLLGRLDLQIRRLMEGSRQLADRLFRDVLFCLMQDASPGGRAAEARALFELEKYRPPMSEPAARPADDDIKPVLSAMRDAVGSAKDQWMRLCAGRQDSLEPMRAASARILSEVGKLEGSPVAGLAEVVRRAAAAITGSDQAVKNEALQLEMATALLLLQHAAEHYANLGADFGAHADLQGRRLHTALAGDQDLARFPGVPLLDEIARQAQEKLLLAQLSHEIQANLHRVEEVLDKFFRDSAERAGLPLVPGLLKQIQGALNMMQLDVAAELVQATVDRIAQIAAVDHDTTPDELNWIADAVSTLGLYVEALRSGREDSGMLRSLLERPESVPMEGGSVEQDLADNTAKLRESMDQWVPESDPETVRAELKDELSRIVRDADLVGNRTLRSQADSAIRLIQEGAPDTEVQAAVGSLAGPPPTPSPESAGPTLPGAGEIDAELLQVYIEEAKAVLGAMADQLARLRESILDRDAFVDIRRGFHTLKGSGRMVGLTALAEVAWEAEQTLNLWLRDDRAPDTSLLDFIGAAATAFRGWVEELDCRGAAEVQADPIVDRARALRGEQAVGVAESAAPEATMPEAVVPPPTEPEPPGGEQSEPELVRIGGHSLPVPLFAIFADEAEQRLADLHRHLDALRHGAGLGRWDDFSRAAHTLAGIARTTGFTPLADAAHGLETWSAGWPDKLLSPTEEIGAELESFLGALDDMLRTILAHEWPAPVGSSIARLHGLHPVLPVPPVPPPEPAREAALPVVADALPAGPGEVAEEHDPQLLAIFLAEADELLPRIGESLREWRAQPAGQHARQSLQRALHTLKGSARMAGAMTLGDATHEMETRIVEQGVEPPDAACLDSLEHDYDSLAEQVDHLRLSTLPRPETATPLVSTAPAPAAAAIPVDDAGMRHAFRAKADILDTLINEAGEVSIARSRVESALGGYKQTAQELTANVERLRSQLRELEIQAETQMGGRIAQMDERQFDPLEFDRYTRLQELTRLMAESVNDVSTAQENLLAGLSEAEYALLQQARTNRNLQQELMQIRMVRLNSQAERLYRIVRQAAKDAGRRARLHIEGGDTELDRTVLDRVIVPFEHLLRNAVAHGIESPEARRDAGKAEQGDIRIVARQEGNEVVLSLSDDGAGIDLEKVHARATALGWVGEGEAVGRERLESFLFMPGFSTADEVTRVAGRGIGLDVVRSEIAAIGGRIRLESETGAGTRFMIRLPSTLALTQVVLVSAGDQVYALPANMVVLVREVRDEPWRAALAAGRMELDNVAYPLRSLPELTGQHPRPVEGRYRTVLLLRSGDERVALRVDALNGNTEVVVKAIGPQLARVPGVAGATVLGDGRVALILNPFGLMERVPSRAMDLEAEAPAEERPPLVLVVDDSLTVRKITGRLLQREGYRVATAKDGVEAMEYLQEEVPAAMLLDIEMPRLDGFEVARHVRADARLGNLPIIMITSRTADKHRRHALELGVNLYMGKPYQEEELLTALKRFTAPRRTSR